MTGDIEDVVRRIVDQVLSRRPRERVATVSSYDPNRHAVKAQLQPEGVETGWIPISTAHVGENFGIAIGPQIGDQIVVGFHEGDIDSPYMIGRLHSDQERPPIAQAGEIVIQTKEGFIFKVTSSSASIVTGGLPLTIDAGGGEIHLTSSKLTHNGLNVGSTHTHGGITPGGADTDVPNP
ncbi:hypothetical protein DTW90_34480 [Neorhizobium sp. P12A]|uniref:phage baseplate assembly protein V n=1 Tax=Neorhizobium sp. P12A TaxID=2268027 RepID=UPI0011EE6AFF|nr:phage baseplate assembly protein V [Neorhizobium sp. P12A]KAA0685995.1 hypothetical protein DTW90_34480 [Neorhizobium sp. P12A]